MRSLPRVDLLLAVAIATLGAVETASRAELAPHAVSVPAALVAGGLVAVRRTHPLVAALGFAALFGAETVARLPVEDGLVFFAELVLLVFSAAAHLPRRPASIALAATLAAVWTSVVLGEPSRLAEDLLFSGIIATAPWAAGRAFHGRHRRVEEVERHAAALELRREADMRTAVAEERSRIARELHDVIAHTVSVMGVQAGGAAQVLDSDPARAREALGAIEQSAREAVLELRRLLGVFREPGGTAALEPQPGLGDLGSLVEQVRRTGLQVDLTENGTGGALSPGVELAAYRIVQEALTNVVKHANARRAAVAVLHESGAIAVEVADDGAGRRRAPGEHVGHGLIGMRERAALYGGTLEAGSTAGGGWRVAARLRDEGRPA